MSPRTILWLCLAALLISETSVATARPSERTLLAKYRRESTGFGTLRSLGGVISSRSDRVEYVTRALRKVESSLDRRLENPITLVLVPDFGELSRLVVALIDREPNDSILGMAFPSRRWAIVREDDRFLGTAPWETPLVTLEHELAHLVIHDRGGDVPRWFDEGLSMWVSQRVLPPDAEAELGAHAYFGGLFPLSHLAHRFPTDHLPGSVAYRQSFLMVQFLVEQHGEAIIPELLDGFDAGESFESIYARVRRVSDATESTVRRDFEERFRAWLTGRNSLVRSLVSIVSIWTIITLVALVAIVLEAFRRRRARRRLAEGEIDLESEEAAATDTNP